MVAVRVLGPVDLLTNGLARPIERIQVRRLLALLASTRGRHWSDDELVDQLWPDELPANPTGALRVVVSRLRTTMDGDGDCIARSGPTLSLAVAEDAVDAWRLETVTTDGFGPGAAGSNGSDTAVRLRALDTALAAWRGAPFVDAPGPPALDAARRRLEELRWQAEEERAALHLACGRPALTIGHALGLVCEHPTRESLARLVAGALALEGRPADALRLITAVRHALARDLGVDPSDALRKTELAILRDDAPLPEIRVAPSIRTVGPRPARPLVGRDTELATLVRPSDPATGRFVLVAGEPGIGKTALLDAAADAAVERATVIGVHCAPPQDDDALARAIGIARAEAGTAPTTLARTVLDRVLERTTDAPVLLVVDDAQWAGPATLAALRMLARRPLAGVTTIVAHRPPGDAAAPGFATTLEACAASPASETVVLGPLDAATLARLAEGLDVPRAQRRTIGELLARLTGGNPFLATTLLQSGATTTVADCDGLPPALELVLDARLARVDRTAVQLLEVATIEPSGIDPRLLAAIARVDTVTCAHVVAELRRNGLVREQPDGRLAFDHELTRIALVLRMSEFERTALHAAAVDHLVATGAPATDIARHVANAGDLLDAAVAHKWLVAGAESALGSGHFDLAAELFAAVARQAADFDVRLRHAIAMESAGRRREAGACYDELLDEARLVGDTTGAARAALGGGLHGATVGGDLDRLRRLAAALDTPPDDDALHLRVLAAYVREIAIADRPVPRPLLRRAAHLGRDDDAGAAMRASIDVAALASRPVTPRSIERVDALVAAAARSGERELVLRGLELRTALLLAAGELEEARATKANLADAVAGYPIPRYRWSCALFDAAFTDLRDGALAGDAMAREALTIGTDLEVPDAVNAYSMFSISVLLREHTLSNVVSVIDRFVHGSRSIPAWHAVFAAALAEIPDRAHEAAAQLDLFAAAYDGGAIRFPDVGLVFATEAVVDTRDKEHAAWLVERLDRWKNRFAVAGVGAGVYGPVDRALARAATVIGDEALAASAMKRAHRLVERAGANAWLPLLTTAR